MSSMNVVDVKSEEKDKKEENKDNTKDLNINELEPEDLLWIEILKTLDKLEKGVEGDLSALGRAVRNINRFRKRLPSTTWCRILHTIIPNSYKKEFSDLLILFINDLPQQEIKLISNLAGVSIDDANKKLNENNNDVFKTLMLFINEKEKLAKIEIKKKQQQLKKEREKREQKKEEKKDEKEEDKKKKEDDMDIDIDIDIDDMDMDMDDEDLDDIKITLIPLKDRKNKRKFYPETYIFLKLLLGLELYDGNNYKLSLEIFENLISFCVLSNRRTSDLLSSRLYQFYGLNICKIRGGKYYDRKFLFDNYKICSLQQNECGQSILIILILESYIFNNLYNLGYKFISKCEFPSSSESSYYARYHFYRGCIDCVQLNYSNSLYHFEQSLRRTSQTGTYGFKIILIQWLIVIQLLMGDIPDKTIFKFKENKQLEIENLLPFLEITQCVKEGNLKQYENVMNKYNNLFIKCGLNKILLRLRHNVIKTGLRKINKSYSKISLNDIANKLGLTSQKNAYFIVSKAIRDGVINAKINYKNKFVESAQNIHIYNTSQPYNNYSDRIKFCLEIRNNAVKNLRYPPKDEQEQENNNDKDDDDFVSPEEIAEIIQKHFEEDED